MTQLLDVNRLRPLGECIMKEVEKEINKRIDEYQKTDEVQTKAKELKEYLATKHNELKEQREKLNLEIKEKGFFRKIYNNFSISCWEPNLEDCIQTISSEKFNDAYYIQCNIKEEVEARLSLTTVDTYETIVKDIIDSIDFDKFMLRTEDIDDDYIEISCTKF